MRRSIKCLPILFIALSAACGDLPEPGIELHSIEPVPCAPQAAGEQKCYSIELRTSDEETWHASVYCDFVAIGEDGEELGRAARIGPFTFSSASSTREIALPEVGEVPSSWEAECRGAEG
jgi:hypothetical protein